MIRLLLIMRFFSQLILPCLLTIRSLMGFSGVRFLQIVLRVGMALVVIFYHACCDIISYDVIQAVSFLFSLAKILRGMNSNFVALLPKVENLILVTDFRPIVMGDLVYKVFTKSLLLVWVASLITFFLSSQFGFIPGCWIHTCIALSSDEGNMTIMIDISKAFDI